MSTKAELLEILDHHDPSHGLTMENTKAELEEALGKLEASDMDEHGKEALLGTVAPDPAAWSTHRPPGARASGSGMWW